MKEKVMNECLYRMKALGLSKDIVIKYFKKSQEVMISEYINKTYKGVLYNLSTYSEAPDLQQAVKDFEEENDAIVYHIIATPFKDFNSRLGNLTYSFLYVKNYDVEWFIDHHDIEEHKQVLAYVVGACDEFGYIGVDKWFGGLYRTW